MLFLYNDVCVCVYVCIRSSKHVLWHPSLGLILTAKLRPPRWCAHVKHLLSKAEGIRNRHPQGLLKRSFTYGGKRLSVEQAIT